MYTVEVPMYSSPMERFIAANKQMHVVLYGSLPSSPFNGGRPNFLLDGVGGIDQAGAPIGGADSKNLIKLALNVLSGFKPAKIDEATTRFYATMEEANQNGMAFWLAATNLFVTPEEITPERTEVFERLIASGERAGVKNAVILASATLEDYLRKRFGDRIGYVASCTKYYEKERFLGPKQTLPLYVEDLKKYDWVVLTPQDSYNAKVMKAMCEIDAEKVIAVADVTCDRSCNAYHHYDLLSRVNKTELVQLGVKQVLPYSLENAQLDCPIINGTTRAPPLMTRVPIIRKAGIRHYKLGRSMSHDMSTNLDMLVSALAQPDLSETEEAALENV